MPLVFGSKEANEFRREDKWRRDLAIYNPEGPEDWGVEITLIPQKKEQEQSADNNPKAGQEAHGTE